MESISERRCQSLIGSGRARVRRSRTPLVVDAAKATARVQVARITNGTRLAQLAIRRN